MAVKRSANFYEILKVSKQVSDKEVKAAFLKLAKSKHPGFFACILSCLVVCVPSYL